MALVTASATASEEAIDCGTTLLDALWASAVSAVVDVLPRSTVLVCLVGFAGAWAVGRAVRAVALVDTDALPGVNIRGVRVLAVFPVTIALADDVATFFEAFLAAGSAALLEALLADVPDAVVLVGALAERPLRLAGAATSPVALRDEEDDLAGAALGALGLGSFEPVVFLVAMQWKAPHERPDPPLRRGPRTRIRSGCAPRETQRLRPEVEHATGAASSRVN